MSQSGGVFSDDYRLASVVAEQGVIVQPRAQGPIGVGGQDIDCLVSGLDHRWPLREIAAFRLLQVRHYEALAYQWVVESESQDLILDTLEDPEGAGRYALPTRLILDRSEGEELASPAVRAAYLTAKRVRKKAYGSALWEEISELARDDLVLYVEILSRSIGGSRAVAFAKHAEEKRLPPSVLWRSSAVVQTAHRLTRLGALALLFLRFLVRISRRVTCRNGLYVLIVGPDGSGKSSLANQLLNRVEHLFRHQNHQHWRPGVLTLRRSVSSASARGGIEVRSRPTSALALGFHWFDFLIGGWFRNYVTLIRSGLVLVERGWWDIAIDPRRYRLRAMPRLIAVLGKLLPQPDLVIFLAGPPQVVARRKDELTETEVLGQNDHWRRFRRVFVNFEEIDASLPLSNVIAHAERAVRDTMQTRTLKNHSAGYAALRHESFPTTRWWIPRGPRSHATAGLRLYSPTNLRNSILWKLAHHGARIGAARFLRRGIAPPPEVLAIIGPHIPRRGNIAVAATRLPGRYVCLLLEEDGTITGWAKVETEVTRGLLDEAASLTLHSPFLVKPLYAPTIKISTNQMLLLEPIPWRVRRKPTRLPESVARSLGHFYRSSAQPDNSRGRTHGDFTPWNLLQDVNGDWALIDWESARDCGPPFYDPLHFFVQSHALLDSPTFDELVEGIFRGSGWVGRAFRAYSEGADVSAAPFHHVISYLRDSRPFLSASDSRAGRVTSVRARLRNAAASW